MCLIILRRLGELISLSSFVHTLPTSSDGCTALEKDMHVSKNVMKREKEDSILPKPLYFE